MLIFLVGFIAYCAAVGVGRRAPRAWLALHLVGACAFAWLAIQILILGDSVRWTSEFALGGEPIRLLVDALSSVFLLLISVVGAAGAVYSHEYWSEADHPRSAAVGRGWWTMLVLSMSVLVGCATGMHFLLVWEIFALSAYFLLSLERTNRESRASAWLYLTASHAGTLVLFVFFATLAAKTGSWELGPMRDQPELAPLFWLVILGFSVKAGLIPFHIWLPTAHANAPSHVSAIMSGVAIKMGVFGIMRFGGWLPVTVDQALTLLGLSVISAVAGIAFGLAQNDLKRLLAYCSVENVGVIMIGVSVALLGSATGDPNWGRLALAGALFHIWNHGLFKSLLFLGAGSLLHSTGTRDMTRLGGLWRALPWTAGLFAFGSVAVSALPPLNGFVSEWLIYQGLAQAGMSRGESTWAALAAAIALAVTGAIVLATFIKVCAVVFLGAPRTEAAAHAHEPGLWMRIPMIGLAALCLSIGLFPIGPWPWIEKAVAAWRPGGAVPIEMPPLMMLTRMHLMLAVSLTAAVLFLFWRVRAVRVARRLTWDCGYAQPTARMQYTSGAFAQLATSWFSLFLRPQTRMDRPEGPFPKAARWEIRTPEAVLELIVEPIASALTWIAWHTRRLQHGRLQAYILYLFVGLAAIVGIVAYGPAS